MSGIGIFRWISGLWLGVMIFFTFGVTTVIFRTLQIAEAREFLAVIFPTYFLANHIAFSLALLALAFCAKLGARRCILALGILALAWVAGPVLNEFWLTPTMRSLRVAGEMADFGRMHGISMGLNMLSILLVFAAAWVPSPKKESQPS
jgi:hypothetical protein